MATGNKYLNIFEPYLKDDNPEHWKGFPELMWSLGFDMDCYKSFEELYSLPQGKTLSNREKQDWIISRLKTSDTQIVGNYVFSRYRYLTHWCDYGYDQIECGYFFHKAFGILEDKLIADNVEREPVQRK